MLGYLELWQIQEPVLVMATIIEAYLHFPGRFRAWKEMNAEWWYRLQLIKWPDRFDINNKFYDLFVRIYGAKAISGRRLLVSAISSLFFVTVLFWVITRIYQTFFELTDVIVLRTAPPLLAKFVSPGETLSLFSTKNFLLVLYDALWVNIIPDMISIAETGWIIKRANRKGSSLWQLFALDLFLTTLIWITAHTIGYSFVTKIGLGGFGLISISEFYSDPVWFSYAVSTYATSAIWIGFIISVLCLATLKRMFSFMVRVLESSLMQEFPVFLMIGIPCLFCWPVLLIIRMIYN